MTEPNTLGQRLRTTRKNRGLTIKQLAEQAKTSPGSISGWETGTIRNISGPHLARVAAILHTTTDYLLGVADPDPEENYRRGHEDALYAIERALIQARAQLRHN